MTETTKLNCIYKEVIEFTVSEPIPDEIVSFFIKYGEVKRYPFIKPMVKLVSTFFFLSAVIGGCRITLTIKEKNQVVKRFRHELFQYLENYNSNKTV